MKKLKLFFACLLMTVLSIGQVWATEYELMLTLDVTQGAPSGSTSTGLTDETLLSYLQGAAPATTDIISASLTGNVYKGKGSGGAGIPQACLKIGKASGAGSITFAIANTYDNVTKLEITGYGWKTSTAVSVNSSDAQSPATALSGVTFSYEISGSKSITINSASSAFCATEIKLYKTKSGDTPTPSLSVSPTSWDFGAVATDAAASKVFSISGSDLEAGTLTLTAPSGYSVSPASITVASAGDLEATNVTVSKNTSNAGTYNDNLTISGCGLEDDVEIALSMVVKAKYTVTWNNNGVTSTTQVLDGEKPVFPATPASCDATSTTFVGWATAPWTGKLADLSEKTVYTSASAMPDVDAAVTYYAVFAKVSGTSGWNLTNLADLTTSDVFVIASANNYAINNNASGTPPVNAITVADGKITSAVADNLKWNIGEDENGYIFYPNGDDSKWLYCSTTNTTGSNDNIRIGTGARKVFELDGDGHLLTNDTYSDRYLSIYVNGTTPQDFRGYVNTTSAIVAKFYKYSEGSASDYMTTCCTKYNVNIAAGIENGSVSADPTSACEGATVTLTFTPAGGYHLDSWSVNGTAQDVAENTFTMPDEAVTVSATFVHDDCTNLLAPTLDGVTKTYNNATIAWNTVTDAVAYAVSVVKDGESEPVFSGNVNVLSKALADLEPETQYNYTIMAIGDGTVKCADGNGELVGNFTTEALPTAHLTLMNLGEEHASSGDYAILTPFNLPTTAAACSKAFVGWDADENCATAPTYAKGAEFTFANTTGVTLYAVYADVAAGPTTNIAYSGSTTGNMSGNNDAADLVDATDKTGWSVIGYKGGGSNYPGLNKDGTIRLYYNASGNSSIDVTAPQTITSVGITCKAGNDNIIVKVGENTISIEDGVYPIGATSFTIINGYTTSNQVHIQNIAVNFPGTPSNWSTTCAAAPEAIVDPEEVNAPAAGVANGVIAAAYENVNESAVAVALYSNAACTEAFTGSWLTASINGDKNIAYTIAENTSYNDARTAYIKLTAPETTGAADPAVVIIPVSQAKKAAVFSSLEELVAADVNANTDVTVSFSNVTIKSIYYYPNTSSEDNRKGVVFNIQKAGEDIKIYFNAKVSEEWVPGGTLSGTLTECPWKIYSDAWQLAPKAGWAWSNLTYNNPPEVASIEIRNDATNKTYIDGQVFNPAGLSVIAIYDNSNEEDVTAYATWTYDPEKLSEGDTEVEVTAEYSGKSDTKTITGLTVGAVQPMSIADFIAAGGARCYLEGIVSNYTNKTKGYFDLTDASGTIYIYGCDQPSEFAEGDKIKVIAEEYLYYQSTTHEAKNVVFVSKVSPVEITITSASTVEMGKTLNLTATTDPAAGAEHITYSIKSGSESKVSLSGSNVLTGVELGEATIIASIPDGVGYLANSVEFTVTVTPVIVRTGTYVKVTSNDDLTDGEYLIVYEAGSLAFNGSLETLDASSNNFAVTIESNKIIATSEIDDKSFTIDFTDGTIKSASGKFIGRTANSNGLNSSTTEAYVNTISIDGGNAVIVGSGGAYMRYNETSGQERFRYFSSSTYTGQKAIQLYKKLDYTRSVSGNYGTICLPKNGVLTNGTLYEIAYYDADQKKIFFDEVENGVMVAGAPYIFQANEGVDKLRVVYTDEANKPAGHKNGLYGHYDLDHPAEGAAEARMYLTNGDYFLRNNQYWMVDQEDRVYVDNYRAYIKLDKIGNDVAPQAYGRRRVSMEVNGEKVATGFENIEAGEAPMKIMLEGQMFILRGERVYDATGRLVK